MPHSGCSAKQGVNPNSKKMKENYNETSNEESQPVDVLWEKKRDMLFSALPEICLGQITSGKWIGTLNWKLTNMEKMQQISRITK